ncbi:MAG: hypothetical protein QOH56_4101 [Pseudonocardiales bacterium]|nr:hypothetical protein [Pseudonocardiales bacterium]
MVIPRSAPTNGAANDSTIVPITITITIAITIALVRQNSTTLAWSEDDTVALRYKLTLPSNALKPSRHLPDFGRAGGSAKVSPRPAEMRAE